MERKLKSRDVHGKPTRKYRQRFGDALMWRMGLWVIEPSKNTLKLFDAGVPARGQRAEHVSIADHHFGVYDAEHAHLAFV